MRRFFLLILFSIIGASAANAEKAIVAGGCFWCVEANFEAVPGVSSVVSGYTGGPSANPTYDNHDGHYEAVEITFDPSRISYDDIIGKFLRSSDVLDAGGQFCDRGDAYRTAIFVSNAAQNASAASAVAVAEAFLGQKLATRILPAAKFWRAEDYHQDYYKGTEIVLTRRGPKLQASAYKFYRESCGRDARVKALWGPEATFLH